MLTNTRHNGKTAIDFGVFLKVCEQYGISQEVITLFIQHLEGRYANE